MAEIVNWNEGLSAFEWDPFDAQYGDIIRHQTREERRVQGKPETVTLHIPAFKEEPCPR